VIAGYHERTIFSVDWSKQGFIATGAADDSIRIFAEGHGEGPSYVQTCHVPKAHAQDVNCVRWNPVQSDILASCGDDFLVKIWKFLPSEDEKHFAIPSPSTSTTTSQRIQTEHAPALGPTPPSSTPTSLTKLENTKI